ncbi:hypothetical protein BDY19DRAFT_767818 [Irpex rosettiformis]|uniref:Uncharacterized protein n=1 Tax=Irpex rosettiformis TaxID=378272 RepID=A0ACB8U7M5_9APHY|nr:hypothetical protein BDY19DRAFT_767818 [Irpex rosettiformis]
MRALRSAYHGHIRQETAIELWARAEMLYFLDKGQNDALLAVFFRYFQGKGTPSPRIISFIQDHFHRRKEKTQEADSVGSLDEGLLDRVRSDSRHKMFVPTYLRSTEPDLERKLEPTRFHSIFVWQALVMMCNRKTLPMLYAELLRVIEEANSTGLVSSPKVVKPGQTPDLFDTVHFNLFIHHLCRLHLRREACAVLRDMKRVQVEPDLETYTTLLAGIQGAPNMTIPILRKIAKDYDLKAPSRRYPYFRPGERGVARIPGSKHATFTLLVYASALNISVDHGHLNSARWIYNELSKFRKILPQENRIVDDAMEKFRVEWEKDGRPSLLKGNRSVAVEEKCVPHVPEVMGTA